MVYLYCMQFATAIYMLEQRRRNCSKSIESIDRAMQTLSVRASQVNWVDPMCDVADRLLSVTTNRSATVRQSKRQLSYLTMQPEQA